MNQQFLLNRLVRCFLILLALSTAAPTRAADVANIAGLSDVAGISDPKLPALQQSEGVAFRTGGVGVDEARAMKSDIENHPLTLLFASRIGPRNAYIADVHVSIETENGKEFFTALADGPYLLVDLPGATYRVTAIYKDKTKSQTVDVVADAHRQLVFGWTGVDEGE